MNDLELLLPLTKISIVAIEALPSLIDNFAFQMWTFIYHRNRDGQTHIADV